MQTADWALVISILSALTSLAGFIWNVWSKFIYPKPQVRVHFSMVTAVYPRRAPDPNPVRALSLAATNMGPSEVILHSALVMFQNHFFQEKRYALMNVLPQFPSTTDYETEYEMLGGGPFAGGFPKKLMVARPSPPTSFLITRRLHAASTQRSASMTLLGECIGHLAETFWRRSLRFETPVSDPGKFGG
jgi:hypothetical protein